MIQAASTGDLDALVEVWAATEPAAPDAEARRRARELYAHVAASGRLLVAHEAGAVAGFAGLVQRGRVAFLTDLFVDPRRQSRGLGGALLEAVLPGTGRLVRCTSSSRDPRALALYARAGMVPRWPVFWLAVPAPPGEASLGVQAVPVDDPRLVELDAAVAGRPRLDDLRYLGGSGTGVLLESSRRPVGYAVVRDDGGSAHVGPAGSLRARDAVRCLETALAWAAGRGASRVEVGLPGPHPALRGLLARGAAIEDFDVFCSSAALVDARRYVPSGGDLF